MIARYAVTDRQSWLDLRKEDVTASDMAALFELHPFKSALQLYVEKTQAFSEPADNAMLRKGRILEDAVARAVAEEMPALIITKANEYLRDPEARIGATPDFWILDAGRKGVMQTKVVSPRAFERSWGDTPPPYIVAQNATEMMLADLDWGMVAALIVGDYKLALHLYDVPRDKQFEQIIKEKVAAFWKNTEAGIPPPPDFARDAAALALLYPTEKKGKQIDLRGDNFVPGLLAEREYMLEIIKPAEERKRAIETEIKDKMRDAEIGLCDGYRISFKSQTRKEHVVPASTFRVLRISTLKESKDD